MIVRNLNHRGIILCKETLHQQNFIPFPFLDVWPNLFFPLPSRQPLQLLTPPKASSYIHAFHLHPGALPHNIDLFWMKHVIKMDTCLLGAVALFVRNYPNNALTNPLLACNLGTQCVRKKTTTMCCYMLVNKIFMLKIKTAFFPHCLTQSLFMCKTQRR